MKYRILILLMFSISIICKSQTNSEPLDLVTKYFNKELRNYKYVLIGEAKEQNFNPKDIGKEVNKEFEILSEEIDNAVIGITLNDGEHNTDLYAFLVKNDEWKIKAFRSLWLPGFFYTMLEEYNDLDESGIEKKYKEMIEIAKQKNDTIGEIDIIAEVGTIDEFAAEIQNMKLTVSSDKDLIDHFKENKKQFENILKLILSDTTIVTKENWRINKKDIEFKTDLNKMLISSISGNETNKMIDFSVGGMIDNSVGYFYCKDKNNIPEMSDNRYIMIKDLGDGWYLYKTT
jgi:hypothetical protein